jgi:hypothetical protein
MIDKNDWRLQGQEKYLKGVTLYLKKYMENSDTWEHDHCEFCWVKFSHAGLPDDLDEGYATKDNHHWICKRYFGDFKDIFQWKIT